VTERLDELRAAFARGFAAAPAPEAEPGTALLRIRLGDEPCAIVLAECARLHADLAIVPMPSPARALLGLAAVRAAIVPIYDLRAILGVATGTRPRWLVIGRDAPVLGYAFDAFDGYVHVATRAIGGTIGEAVRGGVTLEGRYHRVLDLAAIHTSVRKARV
jgi:chemotaxis signal transduction protein